MSAQFSPLLCLFYFTPNLYVHYYAKHASYFLYDLNHNRGTSMVEYSGSCFVKFETVTFWPLLSIYMNIIYIYIFYIIDELVSFNCLQDIIDNAECLFLIEEKKKIIPASRLCTKWRHIQKSRKEAWNHLSLFLSLLTFELNGLALEHWARGNFYSMFVGLYSSAVILCDFSACLSLSSNFRWQ